MERDWDKEWGDLSERERETFTRYHQLLSELTAVFHRSGIPSEDLLVKTEAAMELSEEATAAIKQFLDEFKKSH